MMGRCLRETPSGWPPSDARRARRPAADPVRPARPGARDHRPHRDDRHRGGAAGQAHADPVRGRADPAHALPDGRHLAPGRPGERWRGGPAHQVRAILANAEWEAVGYRLHDIALVPTAEEDRLVGHLGPDVLGPDWDPAEADRRLNEDPDRPVGDALLDQRVIAGIGNLYKNETLFLTGVHP